MVGNLLLPSDIAPIETSANVTTYDDDVDDAVLAATEFFVPRYMGSVENLALMRRMPRLQVCQLLTAGYDHALPYLPAGVILCNARGVHDASTAELAVALTLACLRGLDDAARDMPAGRWDSRRRSALADLHVLIIGAGGVGQAIRRRLEPFEVTISMIARHARADVHAMADLAAILPARCATAPFSSTSRAARSSTPMPLSMRWLPHGSVRRSTSPSPSPYRRTIRSGGSRASSSRPTSVATRRRSSRARGRW